MNSNTLFPRTISISSVNTSGVGCSGCRYALGSFFRKYMAPSMPSLWGMFVYGEDMSIDASRQCSISFMNSVESLMCDGSLHTYGCSHLSI